MSLRFWRTRCERTSKEGMRMKMKSVFMYRQTNLFSSLVVGCARHPDVPQAHWRGVLYGSWRVQVFAAVHDAALQVLHHHFSHVFRERFGMPSQLILCSCNNINITSRGHTLNGKIMPCTFPINTQSDAFADEEWNVTFTWNAFALDGFSNDGSGLMAGLAQSLAELLHAVSIHNDGMPAMHNDVTQVIMLHHVTKIYLPACKVNRPCKFPDSMTF